jgi:hypothetical protein
MDTNSALTLGRLIGLIFFCIGLILVLVSYLGRDGAYTPVAVFIMAIGALGFALMYL